jgi:hypothetical protein
MAIRDLTILLKAWDSATEVLERVTGMADDLDQRVVEGSVDLQDNASKALGQIDQTLYAVGGRMDKVTASFDQVAGSTSAAGWSFSATSGKMQAASNVAERGSSVLSRLSSVTISTARGMSNLSDALEPVQVHIAAIQAAMMGLGTVALYTTKKNEELHENLVRIMGTDASGTILSWAEAGNEIWHTSETARLAIANELAYMGVAEDKIAEMGEAIELYYEKNDALLKSKGVAGSEDLAKKIAEGIATGSGEELKRILGDNAFSADELTKEMDRLRYSNIKYAFATEEVVKKQALQNIITKKLQKDIEGFTAQATSFDDQMGLLANNMNKFFESIGKVLIPYATKALSVVNSIIGVLMQIPGIEVFAVLAGGAVLLTSTLLSLVFVLGMAAGGFLSLLEAIQVIKQLTVVTKLITAAQWLWNIALSANPIGIVIIAAAALAAAIYLIYKRTDLFQRAWKALSGMDMSGLSGFINIILAGLGSAVNSALMLWGILSRASGKLNSKLGLNLSMPGWVDALLMILGPQYLVVKGVYDILKALWPKFVYWLGSLMPNWLKTVFGAISDFWDWLKDKWGDLLAMPENIAQAIKKAMPGLGGQEAKEGTALDEEIIKAAQSSGGLSNITDEQRKWITAYGRKYGLGETGPEIEEALGGKTGLEMGFSSLNMEKAREAAAYYGNPQPAAVVQAASSATTPIASIEDAKDDMAEDVQDAVTDATGSETAGEVAGRAVENINTSPVGLLGEGLSAGTNPFAWGLGKLGGAALQQLDEGGQVLSDGPVYIHEDEEVNPAKVVRGGETVLEKLTGLLNNVWSGEGKDAGLMVKALDRIQSLETVRSVKASSSEAISRLSYQVATALNNPQVQPTAPSRSSQPPEVNVHLEIHRLEINNGTDERAFMNKVTNAVLKGIRQYEA